MEIIEHKKPNFNDDSFFIIIKDIKPNYLDKLINYQDKNDGYFATKREMFRIQDTDPNKLLLYKDNRPSLRNIDNITELIGTIYTHAVLEQNFINYNKIISLARNLYKSNKKNRRNVIRMANSFSEYYTSSDNNSNIDVTCLNLIQYFNDTVKLVFRASDIKNELFIDILNIYEFFIKPVIGNITFNIEIIGLTGQNYESYEDFKNKIMGEKNEV